MAYSSNIVKTKRDGQVTLMDSGAANTLIADFSVGDFSVEMAKPELLVIRDRNTIRGARNGDDPLITFSFTVHMRAIHDTGNDTLLDFIGLGAGVGSMGATTLTSSGGTGYEPFLIDVKFVDDATALGDGKAYTLKLLKCQLIASISEGEPNQIAINGTALGGITVM